MYQGRAGVFISCSEKHKSRVAIPIRQALKEHGVTGFIVSDEPLPPNTEWDPDEKVSKFLDMSDAFVALATPDDQLADGTWQTRPNVVDEIARARERPGLDQRSLAFKAPDVNLHSNINPAHEPLDIDNPVGVVPILLRQMETWGILEPGTAGEAAPAAAEVDQGAVQTDSTAVKAFIEDIGLGEHGKAEIQVYLFSLQSLRSSQVAIVEQLAAFVANDNEDHERRLVASSVLEAFGRNEPALIPIEIVDRLARLHEFTARSCAAHLLWDRALNSPGDVPIALLGRLARPAREDWYVSAPAMAASKELLLRRKAARVIFDVLAASHDDDDRYAVVHALMDVAKVDYSAVPYDLANALSLDKEPKVAAAGATLLELLARVSGLSRVLAA